MVSKDAVKPGSQENVGICNKQQLLTEQQLTCSYSVDSSTCSQIMHQFCV